ncbi:MAG: hypothetical protein HY690_08570 [Chloroflexi bacterium]|nr:hypothetical protein [Chloroflexota bacterium]
MAGSRQVAQRAASVPGGTGSRAGGTVQRQQADGAASQSVGGVDVERLAELVYQKLMDELRLEQDRAGWGT